MQTQDVNPAPRGALPRPRTSLRAPLVRAAAALTALVLVGGLAEAQLVFGKDYQGPTQGLPDGSSTKRINEGDVLRTSNPGALPAIASVAPPTVDVDSGFGPPPPGIGLVLAPLCTAPTPGVPCLVEVDALSHGKDSRLDPLNLTWGGNVWFSVDEFAVGIPGLAPDVASESAVGDAACDVFIDNGVTAAAGPPPWCPMAIPISHVAALDGDGLVSGSGAVYPGLGLIEPTFPGVPPDPGDNLDCLDVHAALGAFPVWFSLDAGFLDPINGTFNTGSAVAHGFVGGDVLFSAAGGPPLVWASAFALGLDACCCATGPTATRTTSTR